MEFVRTMDLTSKQRAQLRGLANGIDTILIVGKEGIGDNLVKQANDALEARELIKGRVLENALMSAREAAEALAVIHAKDESNVESIHEDLRHQILDCKDVHKVDSSTGNMDFFNHMPRFLGKFLVWILTRLDIHGWIPASIIETDPYYTTCVISNLGSIKLNCGYHHLTNWGTCSVFCIIGEKSKRPVYHEDGTIEMREMLDLGLTIDERLADGYYYSKTIRLLKKLLENPELLETPANQEVEY